MTKLEAKELSLKKWKYCREAVEIRCPNELDYISKRNKKLYNKLIRMRCICPLCEILSCDECPLVRCMDVDADFFIYSYGETTVNKLAAVDRIVEKIKAWKVDDDK